MFASFTLLYSLIYTDNVDILLPLFFFFVFADLKSKNLFFMFVLKRLDRTLTGCGRDFKH